MTEAEIRATIAEFVHASRSAIAADLDGVELHGANGYLIEQFLNAAVNQRTDGWGGSIAGRSRFALEIARAVTDAIGGDRLGLRLSPYGVFNGTGADAETDTQFTQLATELSKIGLGYLHVVDHESMGAPPVSPALKAQLRSAFRGTYVLSGGYDLARAEADLAAGKGDLVAFGRPFIANPALVTKLQTGAALRAPQPETFYTPGAQGYTDYQID